MAVKGTGLKTGQLVPHLLVRGVARAINFYAVGAGSTPIMQPKDCFWGDRFSMLKDLFGHVGAIATVKEELTPKEVGNRMRQFVAS